MDKAKSGVRKMQPYSPEWERQANRLARELCGAMYSCAKCGGPVVSGNRCTRCGDGNPRVKADGIRGAMLADDDGL